MTEAAQERTSRSAAVERLRAEADLAVLPAHKARLLYEIAELEESAGDLSGAARNYLAAHSEANDFREPLEALVRLLDRRRSLGNQARVLDALVSTATTPRERARALLLRAQFLLSGQDDAQGAEAALRDALETQAPDVDLAPVWLELEIAAAKRGAKSDRLEALKARAAAAQEATWKGLLLLDHAALALDEGDIVGARTSLEVCATHGGKTIFRALRALETLAASQGDAAEWTTQRAVCALRQGESIAAALSDPQQGDALGVPRAYRTQARAYATFLRAALAFEAAGAGLRGQEALGHIARPLTGSDLTFRTLFYRTSIRLAASHDLQTAVGLAEEALELGVESDAGAAIAAWLAFQSVKAGKQEAAFQALGFALSTQRSSVVARAVQMHMLAQDDDGTHLAAALEAFAKEYPSSSDAHRHVNGVAASLWATAGKSEDAKRALSASHFSDDAHHEIARALARVAKDTAWYEETTLSASKRQGGNHLALFDALRAKVIGSDAQPGPTLQALAETEYGAPVATLLGVLLAPSMRTEMLARSEALAQDFPALQVTLALLKLDAGAREDAAALLRRIDPKHPLAELLLAELTEGATSAAHLEEAATLLEAPSERAALYLEACILRFRAEDLRGARENANRAESCVPGCAATLLYWLKRRDAASSLDNRREAIDDADAKQRLNPALVLERVTLEQFGGDPQAAKEWLTRLPRAAGEEDKRTFAHVEALLWTLLADHDAPEYQAGLATLEKLAPNVSFSERLRNARTENPAEMTAIASAWSKAAPEKLEARLARVAAAAAVEDVNEERRARMALADLLDASEATQLRASASQLAAVVRYRVPAPTLLGTTAEERLVNIDLSPPGSDPRRRAAALSEVGDAVGEDTELSLCGSAGWSALVTKDFTLAAQLFEYVAAARPDDLAAWEGLRRAAIGLEKWDVAASACEHLGQRLRDDERAAAFFAEAASHWKTAGADHSHRIAVCYEKSFERDPAHKDSFEFTFRKLRDQKDSKRILEVIEQRLPVVISGTERVKLLWERARAQRELGANDEAFKTLEYVRGVDPKHVGALALIGELYIRKGEFELAANTLEELSRVDSAPARNRITAGIAAVDLLENKLGRYDRSFSVLTALDAAGLASLSTRERLARAAAKTEAWQTAADIFRRLAQEREDSAGRIDAARLAMRIHLEKIPGSFGLADAIGLFLSEAPSDPEAIDAVLNAPVSESARMPLYLAAHEGLARSVYKAQSVDAAILLVRLSRARGETLLAHLACSLGGALGDDVSDQHFRNSEIDALDAGKTGLRARCIELAGFDDAEPFSGLFAALGPVIGDAFGEGLEELKLSKKNRIDAKGEPALFEQLRPLFVLAGIEPEIYFESEKVNGIRGIAGEKPALVFGGAVALPLDPSTLTRVAAELVALRTGTTLVAHGTQEDVLAIVNAARSIAKVYAPPAATEVERVLSRALPRRVRNQLPELCQTFSARKGLESDLELWIRTTRLALARVAMMVSMDSETALDIAAQGSEAATRKALRGELFTFALSPEFLDFQKTMRSSS